jgi:hypothetical protein
LQRVSFTATQWQQGATFELSPVASSSTYKANALLSVRLNQTSQTLYYAVNKFDMLNDDIDVESIIEFDKKPPVF